VNLYILAVGCLVVAQLAAQPGANQPREQQSAVQNLEALQAAAEREPNDGAIHYQLGRAYAAKGEWEQARRQFLKAIELRPDDVIARLALAQLQVTRGEFDAAVKITQDILKIDKNNLNARLIQAAALMGQKKFSEARQSLDELKQANAGSADIWFQVGVLELSDQKFQAAEAAFRRAQQLAPENSRALMGVVETYMAQNKTGDALKLLRVESEKAPSRQDLLMALGNTAVRAGEYDVAVQTFNRALSQLDQNSKAQGDVYLRIGETYRRKGDLGGAIQALQKARETLPDNVVVLSTLALVLDGAGRKREAKQVYEAVLKLDPNNAAALNNLAFLLAETAGDLDAALTMAQRARQLMPNLYEISDTLGWIYLKKLRSDLAIETFAELVKTQPAHATYRYHLGMAYAQKGDTPNALIQLEEALKLNPANAERDKIQALIAKLRK
jgi:tetratricopeptide (TPR) repeat protein